MASTSDLDRLYTSLTAKTGITRTRDVRLEQVAMDRAYEMRIQQGLTFEASDPIVHQFDQLKARVQPWLFGDRVTENLTWHYYPPTWVDPIDAAVDGTLPDGTKVGWWNSAIHRQQLENEVYTHWGHGIYFEDPPGDHRRWYFVTVFAAPMDEMETIDDTLLAGKVTGFHLTADGKVIHKRTRTLTKDADVKVDAYANVPGRGMLRHIAGGILKDRWVDA